MFIPLIKYDGKTKELAMGSGASVVKGSHCKMSGGYLVSGAAGDNEAEYIALETKTNSGAAGAAYALVLEIDETIQFEAECATTPVQATHVGNDYDFSTAALLDLTATTDKVFHIDQIRNAALKKVVGHFNKPALA